MANLALILEDQQSRLIIKIVESEFIKYCENNCGRNSHFITGWLVGIIYCCYLYSVASWCTGSLFDFLPWRAHGRYLLTGKSFKGLCYEMRMC